MSSITYINNARVCQLLNWNDTFAAVKCAMASVSKERAFQNSRQITKIPNTSNLLFTMPGYLSDKKYGSLGCKLVTYFPDNPNRNKPSIMANIVLMDDLTGELKAIIDGTEITSWRTAAASAVATTYLHCGKSNTKTEILSIIGAGTQGRIHAIGFQYFFNFSEVRVWNRDCERAKNLVKELNGKINGAFVAYNNIQECVRDADVIVTATTAEQTLIKNEWLKKGVHINAVGVGTNRELDDATYRACDVYIDYWDGAKSELKDVEKIGVTFKGQIGDLIANFSPQPQPGASTIFQSLGMAVEDCAMARLIYDLHTKSSS